jgi:hypothetical protein
MERRPAQLAVVGRSDLRASGDRVWSDCSKDGGEEAVPLLPADETVRRAACRASGEGPKGAGGYFGPVCQPCSGARVEFHRHRLRLGSIR